MSTPAPSPITVSVATDKASYNVGDTLTATVTYTDSAGVTTTLTVDATVTDSAGNTSSGSVAVDVVSSSGQTLTVAVTDSFSDSYTAVSNSSGTAVFTATVGSPPAAA